MPLTPCECKAPGYCPRHQCTKHDIWWQLCRHDEKHYRMWEEGKGFCLEGPQWAKGPTVELPPLWKRAKNFALAAAQHEAAGRPEASDAVIQERLAICQGCELFTGTHCAHEKCGCAVNDQKKYFNKLAWADQACPLSKWQSVVQ